jgi:hypothetical protein
MRFISGFLDVGAGRGRCRTGEIGLVAGAEGMASFLASLPWKMDVIWN